MEVVYTPARPPPTTTFIDSIEQQKENILPLSQGRSAKALSKVFTQEGHTRGKALSDGHAAFQKELEAMDELDDPLEVFTRYIKWTVENYPQGHNHESNLVPLLEMATRTLKDDVRYKADSRYLKCWILYSKYVESAKEVFVFLLLNEIGTTLATFYEEYAAILEGQGKRADADAMYRLGIARAAQPLERLQKRYRQFQTRMALQPLTNDEMTEDSSTQTTESRRPLIGQALEQRTILGPRTPSLVSRDVSDGVNANEARPGKLQIFADSRPANKDSEEGPQGQWKDYGTVASRKKENCLEPAPWDGERLNIKKVGRGRAGGRLEIFRDEISAEPKEPDPDDFLFRAPAKITEAELLMRHPFKNYPEKLDLSSQIPAKTASQGIQDSRSKSQPKAETSKIKLPEKMAVDLGRLYPNEHELSFEELRASFRGLLGKIWPEEHEYRILVKDIDGSTTPGSGKSGGAAAASPTVNTKAALADILDMFNSPLEGDSSDDDSSGEDEPEEHHLPAVDAQSGSSKNSTSTPRIAVFSDENASSCRQPATPALREASRVPFGQSLLRPRPTQEVTGGAEEFYGDDSAESAVPGQSDHFVEFDAPLVEEEQVRPRVRGGRFHGINLMTPIAETTAEFALQTSLKKLSIRDGPDCEQALPETPVPNGGSRPPSTLKSSQAVARMPLLEETPSKDGLVPRERKRRRLPWLPNNPCNPHDERYLAAVMNLSESPFEKTPGYFDMRRLTSGKLAELRKRSKTQSTRSSLPALVPLESDAQPKGWRLELGQTVFDIHGKLGEGAFGSVYLGTENRTMSNEEVFDERHESRGRESKAIKVQKPSDFWEFFILKEVESRIASRALDSIIRASRLYMYADESHLLLDYHEQGTLLDAVNSAGAHGLSSSVPNGGLGFDESLAMFFSIELLRTIESLHDAEILHGDLKIDNCLVRLGDVGETTVHLGDYDASGRHGWDERGIVLIDFGRSIDMTMFPSNQAFIAEWETDKDDCFEMREMRPWTFQADYFGLAGIIHVMLFGKYIETTMAMAEDGSEDVRAGAAAGGKRFTLSTPWKRYWQKDIWCPLFDALLNSRTVHPDGHLPITSTLRDCRHQMEEFLTQHGQKNGRNLKMLIRRLESAIRRST